MSNFNKFSSLYGSVVDDVLSQLSDIFNEKLNSMFNGLDVELVIPAGRGFAYERKVKGRIFEVQFWDEEMKLLLHVRGADQFGVKCSEWVSERELTTKLPWKKFDPVDVNLSVNL